MLEVAFHLAMLVTTILLLSGALINAVGLERRPTSSPDASDEPAGEDQETVRADASPTGAEANEEGPGAEPVSDSGSA